MARQYERASATGSVVVGKPQRMKRRCIRPVIAKNGRALKNILRNTFGIKQLRPGQQDVIDSVLHGQDTLAIMPTGAGKSLCYQVPALIMSGMTVVVSPLISLMKDQVGKLEEAGVDAAQVNSALNQREQDAALQSIEQSRSKIVFATPERLTDPEFIASLQTNRIDLFVIDEAHCISQWGHDFRPAYLELSGAIDALGHPPVLALTATATDDVIADIIKQLGLKDAKVINTGILRPNLHYRVIQTTNENEKLEQALRLVQQSEGSGIVYAATVKAAEALHQHLTQAGESVTLYHGKLSAKQRKANQDLFMCGICRVMVATNAFGMGIDKSDTRFVIHFQVPANLEAYYQESGRAGRDGDIAHCTLLYYMKDKRIQQFFLAKHYPGADELQAVYRAITSLAQENAQISGARLQQILDELPAGKIKITLKLLKEGGLISQDHHLHYHLSETDIKSGIFTQLADAYQEKQEHDRAALERMVSYAQTAFCRWKVLLDYFSEDDPAYQRCGVCDNCRQPPQQMLAAVEQQLSDGQAESGGYERKIPLIEVGSVVSVPKFEEGRVISIAGDKVTIEFSDTQTKTFLREYIELA
jgi:ATP-dependent DNA helicase RecQ